MSCPCVTGLWDSGCPGCEQRTDVWFCVARHLDACFGAHCVQRPAEGLLQPPRWPPPSFCCRSCLLQAAGLSCLMGLLSWHKPPLLLCPEGKGQLLQSSARLSWSGPSLHPPVPTEWLTVPHSGWEPSDLWASVDFVPSPCHSCSVVTWGLQVNIDPSRKPTTPPSTMSLLTLYHSLDSAVSHGSVL